MKLATAIISSALATGSLAATVLGQDVSNNNGDIDWPAQKSAGSHFAWIKATEGTSFTDDYFSANYKGASDQGLLRGGYHYAHPDASTGAEQATFFLKHGGGWTDDGNTLPGALDLEYGGSDQCYEMSSADIVAFVKDFGETYKKQTGRYPAIYTTYNWWEQCTGNNGDFGDYPFWIARYEASSVGTAPQNGIISVWQFSDSGDLVGDSDYWLGDEDALKKFAKGG